MHQKEYSTLLQTLKGWPKNDPIGGRVLLYGSLLLVSAELSDNLDRWRNVYRSEVQALEVAERVERSLGFRHDGELNLPSGSPSKK